MNYPKWRYHVSQPEGVIVCSAAEDAALGTGWCDTPADFDRVAEASDNEPAAAAEPQQQRKRNKRR